MHTSISTTHDVERVVIVPSVPVTHRRLSIAVRSEGPDKLDERRAASRPAEKRSQKNKRASSKPR